MVRTVLIVAAIAPAVAFVANQPVVAPRASSQTVVMAELVGATPPLNGFDPLKFSAGATEAQMAKYRECELKHGRIAMAAMLGAFVEPKFHPLAESCHVTAVDDPIKAGYELNFAGKCQILAFCAGVEFVTYKMKEGDKYRPGDVLGAAYFLEDETDEQWVSYQEKELNNGRLAMLAIMGYFAQYAVAGTYDDLLFKPLLK